MAKPSRRSKTFRFVCKSIILGLVPIAVGAMTSSENTANNGMFTTILVLVTLTLMVISEVVARFHHQAQGGVTNSIPFMNLNLVIVLTVILMLAVSHFFEDFTMDISRFGSTVILTALMLTNAKARARARRKVVDWLEERGWRRSGAVQPLQTMVYTVGNRAGQAGVAGAWAGGGGGDCQDIRAGGREGGCPDACSESRGAEFCNDARGRGSEGGARGCHDSGGEIEVLDQSLHFYKV